MDGIRFNLELSITRLKEVDRLLLLDVDHKRAYNLLCETQKVLDEAAIEILKKV